MDYATDIALPVYKNVVWKPGQPIHPPDCTRIEQHRVGNIAAGRERLHRSGVFIYIYAQHDQIVIILARGCDYIRQLLIAISSPGGPKLEHNRLAPVIFQADCPALQILKGKIAGWPPVAVRRSASVECSAGKGDPQT